jgi:hypothetical protein
MLLKKADGSDESGGENSANSEDLFVLAKATEQLGVHALVGVRAENGLIWAGVVCVRVIRPLLEMRAFVIASEHWTSHKASRCFGLGFYEQKVHSLPLF